jgi:hypothetical protein
MIEVDDTPRGVHHRVLAVVLNQLRQAVKHLTAVHVKLFVDIPVEKRKVLEF